MMTQLLCCSVAAELCTAQLQLLSLEFCLLSSSEFRSNPSELKLSCLCSAASTQLPLLSCLCFAASTSLPPTRSAVWQAAASKLSFLRLGILLR